jgi:preprotein translocase subunit SecB
MQGYLITNTSIRLTGNEIGEDMEFGIAPEGVFNEAEKTFLLTLNVVAKDKEQNLDLSLTIKGMFEYDTDDMNELIPYISMNAPAIIFPDIRAYISNITALGGTQPIILPTLNVEGVGLELLEKMGLTKK